MVILKIVAVYLMLGAFTVILQFIMGAIIGALMASKYKTKSELDDKRIEIAVRFCEKMNEGIKLYIPIRKNLILEFILNALLLWPAQLKLFYYIFLSYEETMR